MKLLFDIRLRHTLMTIGCSIVWNNSHVLIGSVWVQQSKWMDVTSHSKVLSKSFQLCWQHLTHTGISVKRTSAVEVTLIWNSQALILYSWRFHVQGVYFWAWRVWHILLPLNHQLWRHKRRLELGHLPGLSSKSPPSTPSWPTLSW